MIKTKGYLEGINRTLPQEPSRMFKYRLDRNERNEPFSKRFIARVKRDITGELFMVYPEMDKVYGKMASWLKVDPGMIALAPGSEQAIKAVFEAFISPGDKVLLHFPGFAMYEVYCRMFRADTVKQSFDSELSFDWDEFEKRITGGLRMVVIESPNGFLGIAPSRKKLESIIEKASRAGAIALVDEAYFHFHKQTVIDLVDRYDNLIIVRTFSKAFGLAGMRVGYTISQKPNILSLKKVRPAYELTSATALLACALIDNFKEVSSYVKATRQNLVSLRKGLKRLGIATSDSKANFVAARLGDARVHDELREALARKDILIRRPFREDWLKEWVRVSTSPARIQRILLSELKAILKKAYDR